MDYLRTREIPILLELCQAHSPGPPQAILDLASPQLLACHLARILPEARVTYANPFPPEIADQVQRREALQLANLEIHSADARCPDTWLPESFDMIVSCSVLEHIEDVETGCGDSLAMQNLARWLRPGGTLAFSVPFSRQGFEESTPAPVYASHQPATAPSCFFQRFYDPASLSSRLIEPSGLELVASTYLGEEYYHPHDIHQRLARPLSGQWISLFLGRSFPWLARLVMRRADDWRALRKPYIAFVVLRKPGA